MMINIDEIISSVNFKISLACRFLFFPYDKLIFHLLFYLHIRRII